VNDPYNLQRFVDAQEGVSFKAVAELRAGRKKSHWVWFIFPQLRALGRSTSAQYYGISSLDEARAYLRFGPLGNRLDDSVYAILDWAGRKTAEEILGPVDAMKLRSSLTLFNAADPGEPYEDALNAFFDGPDERTLALLAEAG
jgi:uncharacterized protein (DUF1810 family)